MKLQRQVKCKGESDVAKSGLDLFFDQGFQRLDVEIRGLLTMVEAAHCVSTSQRSIIGNYLNGALTMLVSKGLFQINAACLG